MHLPNAFIGLLCICQEKFKFTHVVFAQFAIHLNVISGERALNLSC